MEQGEGEGGGGGGGGGGGEEEVLHSVLWAFPLGEYEIYWVYWYKSTNTDAQAAASCCAPAKPYVGEREQVCLQPLSMRRMRP